MTKMTHHTYLRHRETLPEELTTLASAAGVTIRDMPDDGKGDLNIPGKMREGWRYIDIPVWFTRQDWDTVKLAMGEENFYLLAYTHEVVADKFRGQFLLNSVAKEGVEAYYQSLERPN